MDLNKDLQDAYPGALVLPLAVLDVEGSTYLVCTQPGCELTRWQVRRTREFLAGLAFTRALDHVTLEHREDWESIHA